jgi:hypothetical protein
MPPSHFRIFKWVFGEWSTLAEAKPRFQSMGKSYSTTLPQIFKKFTETSLVLKQAPTKSHREALFNQTLTMAITTPFQVQSPQFRRRRVTWNVTD